MHMLIFIFPICCKLRFSIPFCYNVLNLKCFFFRRVFNLLLLFYHCSTSFRKNAIKHYCSLQDFPSKVHHISTTMASLGTNGVYSAVKYDHVHSKLSSYYLQEIQRVPPPYIGPLVLETQVILDVVLIDQTLNPGPNPDQNPVPNGNPNELHNLNADNNQ